jgi:3-deoxy-D-manno-octulosonic-acid transferase
MELMRGYFLNIVYLGVLLIAMPVLLWRAFRLGKYRQGWPEKLWGRVPVRANLHRPAAWFHAVSVGEVLQLQRLVKEFQERHPGWDVVITTTTSTGYQVAVEKFPTCHVSYFPLDFTWAVSLALDRFQPSVLALVELELWPNLIDEAKRRGVSVCIVNGRLSEKSFKGYTRLKRMLAPTMSQIDLVLAQNEEYAERFQALGTPAARVQVTGSIKFDGVTLTCDPLKLASLKQSFQLNDESPVFMAGSTHPPEEEIAIQAWQKVRETYPDLKLLLVPRHAERFDEVANLVKSRDVTLIRRSQPHDLHRGSKSGTVLLLDTLGELTTTWGLADIAFVGGSITQRGGQNMIEPAALKKPVLLGPNVWNFSQIAGELFEVKAAVTVRNEEEMVEQLKTLLSDRKLAESMGQAGQSVVVKHQGAVAKTLNSIDHLLPAERSERSAA